MHRHDHVWALAPGRFVILLAGFVVATLATPFSVPQVVVGTFGLAWVAATAVKAAITRRTGSLPHPRWVACPISPAVDAAFVIVAIAATGGAQSPFRWLLLAAPAIWASARQPHTLALGATGAAGYLIASASDLTDAGGATFVVVVEFLAIYVGAVVSGEATSRSWRREDDLRRRTDDERRAVEAHLLTQARAQQERLVLDMHDGPLQLILTAHQDVLEAAAGGPTDLNVTAAHLSAAIVELRTVSTDLYASVLRDADLAAALHRLASAVEGLGGPPVSISVGADCAGPRSDLVLRAVRELLTNIRKHARARSATVSVSRLTDPPRLQVVVSDDGIGMDELRRDAARRAGHIGLTSIEHAVAAVSGTMRHTGTPHGTEITIEVPDGPRAVRHPVRGP